MTVYPVEIEDGVVVMRVAPDRTAQIRLAGQPVRGFGGGWEPLHVYAGFAPLYLLELKNTNGQEATWYLNENLDRVAGELDELTDDQRAHLGRGVAAISVDPWQSLLADPAPRADGSDFAGLVNAGTVAAIRGLHRPAPTLPPAWVGIGDIAFGAAIMLPGGGSISPDYLRMLLAADLQTSFAEALETGALRFPSPETGRPVMQVHSLYIDNMLLLFRCHDADTGLLFYVVGAGHHMQTVGVFLPALHRIYYFTPLQKHFADTICNDMQPRIAGFLRRHGQAMVAYFKAPPSGFVTPLWGPGFHIGHHLWNELSALDRLVAKLAPPSLPHVAVLGRPGDGEAYGQIERLFPELAAHVVREMPTDADFLKVVFARGWQVLRITGEHVGADLRRRIMALVHASTSLEADRAQLAGLRSAGTPIVVLGLRVENRTVADFELFAERVIEHLQARLGQVAVILDGHNARGVEQGSYPSFVEGRATTPPTVVEGHIAAILKRRFDGSGVTIVDVVGRSMEAGLFWIDSASFFVAPWGAGLAKYRWVCNKPGVIVSSRWVLTEKGDLHIYDLDRYMEAPSPVLFLDPGDAFDVGDEPVLVQVFEPHHPMYYNFKINMGGLYRLIDRFLPAASGAAAV